MLTVCTWLKVFNSPDSLQLSWLSANVWTVWNCHDSMQLSWQCATVLTVYYFLKMSWFVVMWPPIQDVTDSLIISLNRQEQTFYHGLCLKGKPWPLPERQAMVMWPPEKLKAVSQSFESSILDFNKLLGNCYRRLSQSSEDYKRAFFINNKKSNVSSGCGYAVAQKVIILRKHIFSLSWIYVFEAFFAFS